MKPLSTADRLDALERSDARQNRILATLAAERFGLDVGGLVGPMDPNWRRVRASIRDEAQQIIREMAEAESPEPPLERRVA